MNPPYNNIFRKVESAFMAYLGTALSGAQLAGAAIKRGITDETIALPHIYCHCPEGEEDEVGTGNYHVEAEIGVKVSAFDETPSVNADRFANVCDVIHRDTLKASLMTAEPHFTCFGIKHLNCSSELDGSQWVGKIKVGMMVCGSAL